MRSCRRDHLNRDQADLEQVSERVRNLPGHQRRIVRRRRHGPSDVRCLTHSRRHLQPTRRPLEPRAACRALSGSQSPRRQAIEDVQEVSDRPISLLASGIPASASFSVAIHVLHAQEAVHWLAGAVINLDQDSAETPATLADALGRLLIVCLFVDAARDHGGQGAE